MKIIIIGFMGTGKSTVGKVLADKLSLPLIETDQMVLELSGSTSIAEIFMLYGEGYFRRLEREVCQELRHVTSAVVSTGGGVVLEEENISNLKCTPSTKDKTLIASLTADFSVLKGRIKADSSPRPLFANEAEAELLYKKRAPLYEKYGEIAIDVSKLTPEEVVEKILKRSNHV